MYIKWLPHDIHYATYNKLHKVNQNYFNRIKKTHCRKKRGRIKENEEVEQ